MKILQKQLLSVACGTQGYLCKLEHCFWGKCHTVKCEDGRGKPNLKPLLVSI